jgi:hypothetical protein
METDMSFSLVVVRDFGTHRRGDVIIEVLAQTAVLRSEHAFHVVRVKAPNVQTTVQEG